MATAKKMKIGTLGHCPVCEGEFKVRAGKLVHHGYERPGDGMIHGDCFAVGYEPYERSPKGCEDYKAELFIALNSLNGRLKSLATRTYFEEVRVDWRKETITTEYALGASSSSITSTTSSASAGSTRSSSDSVSPRKQADS